MEYLFEEMSVDGERLPVSLLKETRLLLQSLCEFASSFSCLVVLSSRVVRRLISVSILRR